MTNLIETPGQPAGGGFRLHGWMLLPAYPVLAIAGALSGRQVFSLLGLGVLLTVVMLPQLAQRRALPWLVWGGLLALLLLASSHGFAGMLLEAVPVLVNAALACWFGLSLRSAEPLVARFVAVLEGPDRLRQPGVASYVRQITWFWTLLLATQALLLAVMLLCAERSGLLVQLGRVPPLQVPERLAATWLHLGSYLVLGVAFLLEYAWRRIRLSHLDHPGLHRMLLQLARHWPQLVRGQGAGR